MKWKREVPNMSDYLKANTAHFLRNEQAQNISEDVNSRELLEEAGRPLVCHKISKPEVHRYNTHKFLENEKLKYDDAKETAGKCEDVNKLTGTGHERISTIDVDKERQKFINSSWPLRDIRSDAMAVTDSRIDYNGSSPKRFTTTCYLKPRTVPVWYSESIQIKLNSTKRVYSETAYYRTKLEPHYWSEHMLTDIELAKLSRSKSIGTSPLQPRNLVVAAN